MSKVKSLIPVLALVLVTSVLTIGNAFAGINKASTGRIEYPTPPSWFVKASTCLDVNESGKGRSTANRFGMLAGWYDAGGSGWAGYASYSEQLYRVWILWNKDGWNPWPEHSYACGYSQWWPNSRTPLNQIPYWTCTTNWCGKV